MSPEQKSAVTNYLKTRLGKESVELKARKVSDSVEVWLDNEILGLMYIDDEDPNDVSYDLNISILADDL